MVVRSNTIQTFASWYWNLSLLITFSWQVLEVGAAGNSEMRLYILNSQTRPNPNLIVQKALNKIHARTVSHKLKL